jgi:hypothetical protein
MSSDSTTAITVLISILLATSAFLAVAVSQPIPVIKINQQQAIDILKESDKTDHQILNGTVWSFSTNLEYVSLNWTSFLNNSGGQHHSRIYVSDTPKGEFKPYWFISYETSWNYGWNDGTGSYVVDAQSGEVMLSLESVGGGVSVKGPDYLISFQPVVWNSSNPVEVKLGEFTPITLTLTAEPYYDASLPVSIKVNNVPLDFSVGTNNSTAILTTGGSVSFILNVFTPVTYTADFSPPPKDPHPHFDVEVNFLGQTDSYPVYIVPLNQ